LNLNNHFYITYSGGEGSI